jgi:outer membrane lipoprotein SlyB
MVAATGQITQFDQHFDDVWFSIKRFKMIKIFDTKLQVKIMNIVKISIISFTGLLLSGCYSAGGWTPTVDSYNDPNARYINQDMQECSQLADQASGGTAKETAIGAGVGGLVGGAAGAAIGAFTGSPGTGAAMGAAAGAFGGAAKQGFSAEEEYKRAYSSCMRNRGHKVVN